MPTKPKPKRSRKSSAGRKTVLTDERIEDYLRARRRGGNDSDCARIAGIHPSTVRYWKQRLEICAPQINPETGEMDSYTDDEAKPSIPDLFTFFSRDKKAIAEARIVRLAQIEKAAASGSWQAAAWYLERKYPDEYGRRERRDIHVSGSPAGRETSGEIDPEEMVKDRDGAERNKLDEVLLVIEDVARHKQ